MEVTLLGTGDTTGTPTVGCDCDTCVRARAEDRERSRFSVHVRNERTHESILIDASPDFRQQFLANGTPIPDAVVITHIHFDHLDGLGNVYRLRRDLPVFASSSVDEVTGESVAATVRRRYDYLDAVTVRAIDPYEPFSICSLSARLLPVTHPPFDSYGLVIEDPSTGNRVGITGDTNYAIPERSRSALEGVDLLLADGIVPAAFCEDHPAGGKHRDECDVPRTFGSKHMTREGAMALADRLDVGQVRIVHVSHFYPADEAFEAPLAVDGEQFSI